MLCPDPNNPGQEGICDSKLSAYNADSWTLVIVGSYYTRKCGREIPLPEDSSSSSADDSSCPAYDDSSYDSDPLYGIIDYAHFGDSYAAGMGTGTTTGDSCRVGSNSYGELVQEWFDNEDFSYTNFACSGDTTVELNKKIDQWLGQNPTGTTMATLTIGGNDVFFSDLVSNCVLTMWWYSLEQYRQWCLETEEKARNLMQDTGSDGLGAKLRAAYEKVLDGSGSTVYISLPFHNHPYLFPLVLFFIVLTFTSNSRSIFTSLATSPSSTKTPQIATQQRSGTKAHTTTPSNPATMCGSRPTYAKNSTTSSACSTP